MRSRPRTRLALFLLPVLLLAAAACGGGDDDDGSAPTTAGGGAATTTSTTEADSDESGLTRRDAGLDLPRTVVYAGVELTVTDAVWSNAQPPTYGDDEPTPGTAELFYLELSTRFVDGFPGTDALMPVSAFAVETADGTRVPARGTDFTDDVPVAASRESRAALAFQLDEDELAGAVLLYGDGTRIPARLPLTGDLPDSPYPIRVEVGTTVQPDLPTGCDPSPADVTLTAVEWDVDAGVGLDGEKLAQGRSSRATLRNRWLRAELSVTATAGQCGGTYANSQTFRLLADGVAINPVNSDSYTLADGVAQPMSFLFEVPVDTAELALEIGRVGDDTASIDLDVPSLPDPGESD